MALIVLGKGAEVGLAIILIPLAWFLIARGIGRLVDHFDSKRPSCGGGWLVLSGAVLLLASFGLWSLAA